MSKNKEHDICNNCLRPLAKSEDDISKGYCPIFLKGEDPEAQLDCIDFSDSPIDDFYKEVKASAEKFQKRSGIKISSVAFSWFTKSNHALGATYKTEMKVRFEDK